MWQDWDDQSLVLATTALVETAAERRARQCIPSLIDLKSHNELILHLQYCICFNTELIYGIHRTRSNDEVYRSVYVSNECRLHDGDVPRQERICFFKKITRNVSFSDGIYERYHNLAWVREWRIIGLGVCEKGTRLNGVNHLQLRNCAIVSYKDLTEPSRYGPHCVIDLSHYHEKELYDGMKSAGYEAFDLHHDFFSTCMEVALANGVSVDGPYVRRDCTELSANNDYNNAAATEDAAAATDVVVIPFFW